MTHSFDKTYLARLGFGDVDRKMPEHDRACQYLGSPGVSMSLAYSIWGDEIGKEEITKNHRTVTNTIVTACAQYEVPLVKGSDQYKVTLGFLDLVIPCRESYFEWERQGEEWGPQTIHSMTRGEIVIEVKIGKTPVSEIVRQINFYREHIGYASERVWIAAVRFDISTNELSMLRSSHIRVIRLGDKFDEYLAQHENDAPAEIQEV